MAGEQLVVPAPTVRAQEVADFTAWVADHHRPLLHFAQLVAGDAPTGEDLLQIALARAYLKWSKISARDEHPLSYVRRIIMNETSGAAPAGDASSRWELPDMTPVRAHMVFDEANRLNFTVGSPASGGPIDASFAFMACDLSGQCWFSTARYADPIDFGLAEPHVKVLQDGSPYAGGRYLRLLGAAPQTQSCQQILVQFHPDCVARVDTRLRDPRSFAVTSLVQS